MKKKKKSNPMNAESGATVSELRNISSLLQNLLIVELASKGVSGPNIRKIVSVDYNRVARIVKQIKTANTMKKKR